jgi:hypothetical protein
MAAKRDGVRVKIQAPEIRGIKSEGHSKATRHRPGNRTDRWVAVLGGAEGAVRAISPTPEIALPFEGVFRRAA